MKVKKKNDYIALILFVTTFFSTSLYFFDKLKSSEYYLIDAKSNSGILALTLSIAVMSIYLGGKKLFCYIKKDSSRTNKINRR